MLGGVGSDKAGAFGRPGGEHGNVAVAADAGAARDAGRRRPERRVAVGAARGQGDGAVAARGAEWMKAAGLNMSDVEVKMAQELSEAPAAVVRQEQSLAAPLAEL